jgi:hypothetical protein
MSTNDLAAANAADLAAANAAALAAPDVSVSASAGTPDSAMSLRPDVQLKSEFNGVIAQYRQTFAGLPVEAKAGVKALCVLTSTLLSTLTATTEVSLVNAETAKFNAQAAVKNSDTFNQTVTQNGRLQEKFFSKDDELTSMRAELDALREQKETSNAVMQEIYFSKLSEIQWLSTQKCNGCKKVHGIFVNGQTSLFDMCNTRICFRIPPSGQRSEATSTAKSRLANKRKSGPKATAASFAGNVAPVEAASALATKADMFDMKVLTGVEPGDLPDEEWE